MVMEEKAGRPKRPDNSLPLIESLITNKQYNETKFKKQTNGTTIQDKDSAQNKSYFPLQIGSVLYAIILKFKTTQFVLWKLFKKNVNHFK